MIKLKEIKVNHLLRFYSRFFILSVLVISLLFLNFNLIGYFVIPVLSILLLVFSVIAICISLTQILKGERDLTTALALIFSLIAIIYFTYLDTIMRSFFYGGIS